MIEITTLIYLVNIFKKKLIQICLLKKYGVYLKNPYSFLLLIERNILQKYLI